MEITIQNPHRKRKFGWGYNLFCNSDGSVDAPGLPVYEGTLHQVYEDKQTDRTWAAHQNNYRASAWFYQGKRISATWCFGLLKEADDLPFPGYDDDQYDQWERQNRDHHFKNDKWGYGWFRGFIDEPGRWENRELKVRVTE